MQKSFPVLVFALIFFTMLPVTMIVPVFKDFIKDRLGGTDLSVSIFMSSAMLGSFLFSPVAGFLSDRFRTRKNFIAVFSFFDGLCFFAMPSIENLNLLQALRFIEGACHIFVIGLLLASISDRENDPSNTKFYRAGILLGISGMLLSLGVGIGSPLGILGKKNPLLPFYVAGTLMVSIGLLSTFFLKDYEVYHTKKVTIKNWMEAFQKNKFILLPYIYTFIDRFSVGFIVTTLNLHLRETVAMHPGQVGMALAFVLIPMSLLSYPFAILSKKYGSLFLMMAGSAIYGLALGSVGFTLNTTLILTLLLIAGIGAGVMFVPSMIFASELAPDGYNASVMSGFTGAGSIGFMLGPILSVLLSAYLKPYLQENTFSVVCATIGGMEILVVLLTIPFFLKTK
jgi:MFS family permease